MTGALRIALVELATFGAAGQSLDGRWPLWERYAERFLTADGRVVDRDADNRTTSEGQAYGAFFALVANDRQRFDRILSWTVENLCEGDVSRRLPAWHWGVAADGQGKVMDANAASDADLWLAYSLFEAGRLWRAGHYTEMGAKIARRIQSDEVVTLPGFGPMLLPGPNGFAPAKNQFRLNPSYLPPQLLRRLSEVDPRGPWAAIHDRIPALWRGSRVGGFVADWTGWTASGGFDPKLAGDNGKASYDAIRVYLWAGMLHPDAPNRSELIEAVRGMVEHLRSAEFPPEDVGPDGRIRNLRSGVGFSAAVLPLLLSVAERDALIAQRRRVSQSFDSDTRLYGRPARYYDQCLVLFGLGWTEERFRFGPDGQLIVRWKTL